MNFLKLQQAILVVFVLSMFFSACTPEAKPGITPEIENRTSGYSSKYTKDWINLYMDIEKDIPGFRPAATSRAVGYIWMAAYESALPGMPDFISNEKKLTGLDIPALPKAVNLYDWNVAMNAALARTYEHFMFSTAIANNPVSIKGKASIKDLESNINSELSGKVDQAVFTNSQEWGRAVADAIIAYAKTDLEAEKQILDPFAKDYTPPTGPGKWKGTTGSALFPYWGLTRSFATFGDDLISPPPPPFSTNPQSTYYKDFKEVNDVVVNKTNSSVWIAEFWSDDIVGLTFSPPARVFQIANQMIVAENLNLETTLHLLVKLGIAENDAAIAAWGTKYTYNVERPTHFIKDHINPDFKTLLGNAIGAENITPPFPGYPSGHSTFGGMGRSVLAAFFGENYTFTDRCHEGRTEFNGYPRSYTTMTQIAEENAYSRIPLGVHPRFDCSEGLRLGYLVGDNAVKYNLKK
jgi:membrane-associated phospholipid phosphatase